MIELNSHSIEQPSIEFQRISWTIKPTTEDIATYFFGIFRSNSPEGPFDIVKDGLQNAFHYDDFDLNQKNSNRVFYYKIRITSPSKDFKDYGPYYTTLEPDSISLEMIRKKNVYLNFGSTPAKPVEIFIRKTWGTYCPECFDTVKGRKIKSNCVTCYNTNYVGGFFSPITTKALFGLSNKTLVSLGFEFTPDKMFIETVNYPILSPGDIVKQSTLKRYRINTVRSTRRGTYIISQFSQLDEVNFNDIEYEL